MGISERVCDCDIIHESSVKEVKTLMPDEEQVIKLSELFKVFSDNTRVKILWALDKKELCVCDIAAVLNMTKSAVSHQLKYLRTTNLVKYRRDGKSIFYSLSDLHVREIFEKAVEHINE